MEGRDELGRFTEGYKGGPGRPPKGEALTDVLKEKVDKELIADKLIHLALEKNDLAALKYIYDRIDGTPRQTILNQLQNMPDVVEIDLSEDKTDTGNSAVVEE